MSIETIQEKQYQYSLEVGHAKQGSEHVLIIKSLKVRDDNLADCIAQLKAGLNEVKIVFDELGVLQ